jgi:hypothetical protein
VPAQQVAKIPKVEHVVIQPVVDVVKPQVSVAKVDGKSAAVLDKQGMKDLISLYQTSKQLQEERVKLVTVTNKVIDERNDLLLLAQQEEAKGNDLRQKLADVKSEQDKDRLYNAIELNATRLLLLLSLISGL